jgi:hypothetical protein
MNPKRYLLYFMWFASAQSFGQTVASTGVLTSPASTNLMLRTNAGGTTNFLTILNSGNLGFVGIGASLTPTERLHVSGNILASGTSGNITATGNLVTTSGIHNVNHTTNPFIVQVNSIERMRVLTGGNVGIGITAPVEKLHISGGNIRTSGNIITDAGVINTTSTGLSFQVGGSNKLTVLSSGNVGIGTTTPTATLDVFGTIKATNIVMEGANVVSSQWTSNGSNINFNAAGMVSIGTVLTPLSYKLAVGGKIIAEEVVVKLQSNWPDYVFEKDYKLSELSEIEEFIKANKHLPGVPSEIEIKENGIAVGEMNGILLKKIEELTLLLIEQEKRIAELELAKPKKN